MKTYQITNSNTGGIGTNGKYYTIGGIITAAMWNEDHINNLNELRTMPSCEGCGARIIEKNRCAYCGANR